ncbi:hypothetical protein EPUS_02610 [Endocarpon pusillum Z07020]|uniref:Uncharacterized protein n=1 Tax=Endocarpon pusillum (strain Z07020 / HMAS-L-300199) TaxID=1263415 RepID=U1I474_ENDPU|nr:uncharacterized protein EPUS_02610 [Endocarpon pusillum Z07020]ERF76899.1 hypothetical protein EPUS_02610 [Endocarpon pusillum Z07020]
MDQQGTPIGANHGATKVKTESAPPIQESTGPVASDSLAAESYKNHGAFAENKDAAPSSVKGASSTFNNQDTSGAKVLPPALDAEARESQEAWNESSKLKGAAGLKYPEGAGAQPDFTGVHNKDGYYGGPAKDKQEINTGSGEYASGMSKSGSGHTGGEDYRASTKADPAPSYVMNATGDGLDKGTLKPKGRNITEGGFDSDDSKNASFNAEIGTENDPGRAAELKLQRENAETAGDAGSGSRQKGIANDGVGYETLKTDEEA